jgi:hypothetical protein
MKKSKIPDFFGVIKKPKASTQTQEESMNNYDMSETSHVENVEAKENSQEAVEALPLQYTPLEKMLLEKVNEMKYEREELLSLLKELKEELGLAGRG